MNFAMNGNGPENTFPLYGSDEKVFIRSRGDFANLTNASEQMAAGNDGVIAPGAFWTLTSASIDFQGQGVKPQMVIQFTEPKIAFPGSTGKFFAIDTVAPNQVGLRVIGKPLNVGQPPAPALGLTAIKFVVNTLASLIEDASFDLKSRFGIDEQIPFHASFWIYKGREDIFRDLRAACVLQVIIKAMGAETRSKDGDWAMKLANYKKEYDEVLDRVQLRFGPYGNDQPPVTRFSCQISR
jgi:hypothetical protein